MKVVQPVKLDLLSCSLPETDATDGVAWNAQTTYAAGKKVRRNHQSYESAADENVGKDPELFNSGPEAVWRKLGATMPYRMLDDYMGTQTIVAGDAGLKFTLPYKRANSFALLNVDALEVHTRITDDLGEVLFDKKFSLIQDISRLSAYEYIFYPVKASHEVIVTSTDMPIFGQMDVSVIGNDVGVGHIVAGRSFYIGSTQYGAEYSENDYSKKIIDEYGVAMFVQRNFASNVNATLILNPNETPGIANIMRDLRATPALWIGDNRDDGLSTLTTWGWKANVGIRYDGPNKATISITINGLI